MHAGFMGLCLPMLEDLMSTHRCNSAQEQHVLALQCRADPARRCVDQASVSCSGSSAGGSGRS